MTASFTDISGWYDEGKAKGASHLIVGRDNHDFSNFPIYVTPSEKPLGQHLIELQASGNGYDEIYSYSPKYTKNGQMAERRAMHLD